MRVEVIGNATLYLGDCREIIPALEKPYCIISDPPYGISAKLGMGGGDKGDGGMWKGVSIVGDGDVLYRDTALQLSEVPFAVLAKVNTPAPHGTKATVVWDKGEHTGAGDLSLPWKPSFEVVYVGGDGWAWKRRIGGIVRFNAIAGCVGNRNDGHRHHPFEKPVELMAHFVERAPGNIVLDPFMGSGTTGVAAIKYGRKFIGIEIEEQFFDIACKRLARADSEPLQTSWDEMWNRPYDGAV